MLDVKGKNLVRAEDYTNMRALGATKSQIRSIVHQRR